MKEKSNFVQNIVPVGKDFSIGDFKSKYKANNLSSPGTPPPPIKQQKPNKRIRRPKFQFKPIDQHFKPRLESESDTANYTHPVQAKAELRGDS